VLPSSLPALPPAPAPALLQGGGVNDASMLLKPLLARGELRCIGATTPDKYRRFIEKDPALERRFQTVGRKGGFRSVCMSSKCLLAVSPC
jgi:hypothetical protein